MPSPPARPRVAPPCLALLVALALARVAGAAGAAEPACDRFFPDLSPCGRRARPEGSVPPMSFPFLFEDPYITTGTNAVGIWHSFPHGSIFAGGQMGAVALQGRLAITDRLAFIATKDGYAWVDSDTSRVPDHKGFFNLGAGFKVAAWTWEDDGASAILTPSLRYEIPLGQQDVYQGHSDGILIPALSAGFHDAGWNVLGDVGGQWGIDRHETSSSVFYNLHVDHAFPVSHTEQGLRFIVPFIELNGLHWVRSGDGSRRIDTRTGGVALRTATAALGVAPFEGADVFDLGSDRIAGTDLVTMAWGVRLPVGTGLSFGAAYERPLSTDKEIFEQRVTVMITWEL